MLVLQNWQEEKRAAYLYRLIAKNEVDLVRRKLFLDLSVAAEEQAAIWEKKCNQKDKQSIPLVYKPDMRARIVGMLANTFGAEAIRFILSAMKVRGMSVYSGATVTSHSAATHLEKRHKGITTAGNLRAAVFGVSDGLVSNASLVLGIVGANAGHNIIILSGIAGLLAGACSMAAGEYISMRSQREFFEYQIELEKEELELYPEEEAAELACIYRARGVPKEDAKKLADLLISDSERALDTLAREELGLNPHELGSPMGAAISSFLSFAFGAFIPVLPYLFGQHDWNLWVSLGLTVFALFSIGGLLSLFTNRSAWISAFRMLAIGLSAGALTFFIGKLLGVALQ